MIRYINTDLDAVSSADLSRLVAELESKQLSPLSVTYGEDGLWYAIFETDDQYEEPEANIAAMLDVLESLDGDLLEAWHTCSLREFNVGYDCGSEPWAFNNGLSNGLLQRIGRIGASIRITLYPPEPREGT
jgi:hypothetical protein